MKLSVIIPAYNEEARILPTLQRFGETLASSIPDLEVLVGDDGSGDNTAEVVSAFCVDHHWCRLVSRQSNQGKGAILRELVAETTGDIVIYSDADMPVDPEYFPRLFGPICDGAADLVQVSRWLSDSPTVEHVPPLRVLISQAFRLATLPIKPAGLTDTQCGCKALRGELARDLFSRLAIDGFAFDLELLLLAQARDCTILELPLPVRHVIGSSIQPFQDSLTMVRDLVKLQWSTWTGRSEDP